jgi:hypothetical protein
MRHGADAAGGDIDRTGLAAGSVEELLQSADVQPGGIDRQHFLHAVDGRDRRKVAQQVEPGVGVDQRGVGEAGIAHQHGVAVGRRTGDHRGADRSAGTAAVVDHDRLVESLADVRSERTGEGVGRAAGRERHDPGDRLLRPFAGACTWRHARGREATKHRTPVHVGFFERCQITSSTMMPATARPAKTMAMVPPTRAKIAPNVPCPIASTACPPVMPVVSR